MPLFFHKRLSACLFLCALCLSGLFNSCVPPAVREEPEVDEQKFYTMEKKMLVTADSLFGAENYELAKIQYTKIRDEFPQTAAGAMAQYKLGYINIYFDNPFADYRAAQREFKRFLTDYPEDKRIDLIKNWVRLLTVFEDFDREYHKGYSKMQQLDSKEKEILDNFGTLQDAYFRCEAQNDSLQKHIQKLEGIIQYIEKGR